MFKGLLVAPVAVLFVGGGCVVQHLCTERYPTGGPSDPSFGMDADGMRALNDEHRPAPLLLPVEMPPGYGWAGIGEEQGDGRRVWARTSQFTSVDGGPVIELCAKAARQKQGCEQDDDPYLTRTVEGMRVFVSIASPDHRIPSASRLFWSGADMTTDYEEVRWLND